MRVRRRSCSSTERTANEEAAVLEKLDDLLRYGRGDVWVSPSRRYGGEQGYGARDEAGDFAEVAEATVGAQVKPLIIYHANCMDGAAAALAAWLKFGEEAEYRPANYGEPAPTNDEVRGRDVYVLDFSYPRVELVRMRAVIEDCRFERINHEGPCEKANRLWVLDHHKTAQTDLDNLPFCVFDMRKSGAVMAWEYFHCSGLADPPQDEGRVPELFRYVQDRDLWRWELPYSRAISAALTASGALTDFRKLIDIYRWWSAGEMDDASSMKLVLARDGSTILRVERQQVERIVATAEEVEILVLPKRVIPKDATKEVESIVEVGSYQTYRCLAATSAVLQSEVGEALALESARRGRDAIGVVYYRDGKAGKWRVSLRSRDAEHPTGLDHYPASDVSAIAKTFGGGGHAKAAGFECDDLPWSKR